jgi:hypothetical protein
MLYVGRHIGVILTGYVPIESVGTRGSDLGEERPGKVFNVVSENKKK